MDPQQQEEDLLRDLTGDVLLLGDAFWVEKCRSHLSKASKQDVLETDRHIHGGVYRWHASKVSQGKAPCQPPSRGIPGPERL